VSTPPLLILDVILAGLLLLLAVAALHSRSLRQSIILFIVFGLVTALAWARLKAPDVALAEAAIGSGVAGALLLAALRDRRPGSRTDTRTGRPAWQVLVVTYLVIGLTLTAAWAFLDAQTNQSGLRLGGLVQAELANSGVSNPVTAVLLNFRAYDTLLELAVLFAALLGVLVLGPERASPRIAGPIVTHLVAWLTPLLIVTAGYLLWVGAHAPGGAFQAGALLAAAGIVIRLSGNPNYGLPSGIWMRLTAVAGCGVFMFVGLASMAGDASLLQYPADWASTLILLIEVFATLSIAASLVLVYLGGQPDAWASEGERGNA
jgi:multisubunit Na+/H+ antiporter MnhB subunit